jgi:hypothetical protein
MKLRFRAQRLFSRFFLPVCFAVFSISAVVHAAGTMTLDGKVKSFSPETVEISDGSQVFSIQKSKLGPTELLKVKNAKAGTVVRVQVPFTAVLSAKAL